MFQQSGVWKSLALAAALALGGMGAAQAVTIGQGLVNGENTIIDESRETYVDANRNGLFDVGDVIYGYIRISDYQPSGLTGNNQGYGVFSQQIIGSAAGGLIAVFGATTVAGLTLNDLLPGLGIGPTALAAFFDSPVSYTDLINSNPGGQTMMQDYLTYIKSNGTLELVAGFTDGDDFLQSLINPGTGLLVGTSNSGIPGVTSSVTIASNVGAMSVQYQGPGLASFLFNDIVPVVPYTGGLVLAEVAVSSGTTAGAAGAILPNPKDWLNAGAGFQQCGFLEGADVDCGFIDKNNFTVNVTKIPEPGSLALLSLALVGLGGFARRRNS